MSEMIHNRPGSMDPARQHHLRRLIKDLHQGRDPEDVKREFAALFASVSSEEIAAMEAELMAEGMPVEEIQRLCDVHAAVMGTSVAQVHGKDHPEKAPGHPLNQLEEENRALEELVDASLKEAASAYRSGVSNENAYKLLEVLNTLTDVDKHYLRKENLIFPFLEKAGITAPPKVMWGVHDEIRVDIKKAKALIPSKGPEAADMADTVGRKVKDMIFKERNILYPMLKDALTEDDWAKVEKESDDVGYCLVAPKQRWIPARAVLYPEASAKAGDVQTEGMNLGTGTLTAKQLELMLNTMPVDVTFIDADDTVRYFSNSKERIFVRSKAVLGRAVQNCHPPKSMPIVQKILDDFRSKMKDHEDFWINMGGKTVYIRYFAVRDEDGSYLGTLEVSQEISGIKGLEGEKRMMS
ncbi:MAG: hypothetical protein BWY00_00936 [Firmicutes bacterium ADurb.Bin153]|nr:MAG: hypothetical protein BWY00_00936 [Firmicutes bacterium ADurb.Bin153]